MQDVKAVPVPFGQINCAPRGNLRGPVIANPRVIGNVGRVGKALGVFPNGGFIFAMRRKRQTGFGENAFFLSMAQRTRSPRETPEKFPPPHRGQQGGKSPRELVLQRVSAVSLAGRERDARRDGGW